MKKPTVTLDTNVIVSGIILKRGIPFTILRRWEQKKFTLVLSNALLEESRETLSRLKIIKQYDVPAEGAKRLIGRLKAKSKIIVSVNISLRIPLRDPKDAVILGTAISGRVDYLVTGDKDLLVLDRSPHMGTLRIITPRQFLDVLAQ